MVDKIPISVTDNPRHVWTVPVTDLNRNILPQNANIYEISFMMGKTALSTNPHVITDIIQTQLYQSSAKLI